MPLLFLLACAIAPPKDDGPPGDTARDTPPPHTGATDTGGTDTGGTDTGGTDTAPVLPTVHGVEPHVADPEGGGGRVVVTLDTTAGVVGVALGGVPLTDFAVDDATRVSGVPGAHPAGVVELTVTTAAGATVGAAQQGLDTNSAPLLGLHSYDTLGAGWPGADGWDGDVGAVVVVAGAVSREDRLRLDEWAQQRFGTPDTPPIDDWERVRLGELPEAWHPRDGAQAVELGSGRVLAIGGWSPYDPWDGSRTTNEVWASDDRGATWSLLLPHDPDPPETGAGARFPPGHTVGVTTWQGRAVVIGTDPNDPPYGGEVWVEGDDGATWTRVSTTAPTAGRCLFLVGSLGDDLYVMGGQTDPNDAGTGLADVWRSADGGVTWEALGAPPWSPRGMVYRPVEHDGRLYVVGGGLNDAAAPVAWDGVYAFDGTTWTTVLPDGHGAFAASYYHALAVADGRLWLFNGFTGTEELNRALYSDDGGHTWAELSGGAGGEASHADTAVGLAGRVLRVSGNLSERAVYAFEAGG